VKVSCRTMTGPPWKIVWNTENVWNSEAGDELQSSYETQMLVLPLESKRSAFFDKGSVFRSCWTQAPMGRKRAERFSLVTDYDNDHNLSRWFELTRYLSAGIAGAILSRFFEQS
jgi:hypothetical protein